MHLRASVAGLVFAGACLHINQFGTGGGDGGSSGDGGMVGSGMVGASVNGGGVIVQTHDYTMVFSEDAYHFPTSLKIGSDEMLASGGDCTDEQFTGVSYYPAYRFDGISDLGRAITHDITINLAGPAVAKVQLDWEASIGCSDSTTVHPLGHSIFTFFPDGRINRWDQVTETTNANSTNCMCNPGGPNRWYVTGYWAFARNQLVSGLPLGLPSATDNSSPGMFECVEGAAHRVAAGWHDSFTRLRAPVPESVALIYDFDTDNSVSLGNQFSFSWPMTVILDDAATCSALNARIPLYAAGNDPQLVITGANTTVLGLASDGTYGGQDGISQGVFPTAGNPVNFHAQSTTIPAGWALWVDFQKPFSSVDVTPATTRYVWQPVEGTTFAVFFFYDPLTSSDNVTITPL